MDIPCIDGGIHGTDLHRNPQTPIKGTCDIDHIINIVIVYIRRKTREK